MSKKSKLAAEESTPSSDTKVKGKKDKREKKEKKSKSSDAKSKTAETSTFAPKSLFDAPTKDVDKGLASLFSSNHGPVNIVATSRSRHAAKLRSDVREDIEIEEEDNDDEVERALSTAVVNALAASEEALKSDSKKKRKRNAETAIEDVYLEKLRDEGPEPRKKPKKNEIENLEKEAVDGEGDATMADDDDKVNGKDGSGSESDESDDSDEDEEPQGRIRHETEGELQNKELDKASRTVFVGNLPSSVISERSHYKTLKSAFKAYGPVSSVRFRSIAFSDQIPRKAAFITKALHVDQKNINAYIVFKTAEAARSSLKLNGTVILNHHIRVDSVAHPAKNDSRRCVFVGNLDFEAAEETLWKHFGTCGKVDNVRLVRDAKTNVGKGFAYVQFEDEVCVDKALLLDGKAVQGDKSKRKLRVTRAKNMKRKPGVGSDARAPRVAKKTGVYVPKADPKKSGMAGRARKLLGRAGGAKVKKMDGGGVIEGTRAVPGMDVGLKVGGSGKKKGKPRGRQTARSSSWKKNPAK